MLFSCSAGVFCRSKTVKCTPSKRTRPPLVPTHRYPSRVWAKACTVCSGSPSDDCQICRVYPAKASVSTAAQAPAPNTIQAADATQAAIKRALCMAALSIPRSNRRSRGRLREKSPPDPTFGGSKKCPRGIEWSFSTAMLERTTREGNGTEPIAMSSYVRFISKGSQPWRFQTSGFQRLFAAGALLLTAPFWPAPVNAQAAATPIRIDASQPWREPGPARYDEGSAVNSFWAHARPQQPIPYPRRKTLASGCRRVSLFALPARPVGRRNPQDEGRRRECHLRLRDLDPSRRDPGPVRLDGSARPARLRPALRQTRHVFDRAHRPLGPRRGAQRRLARLGAPGGPDPRERSRLSRLRPHLVRPDRRSAQRPALEGWRSRHRYPA